MKTVVDVIFVGDDGDEREPLFAFDGGSVSALSPFAEDLAKTGITINGSDLLFPKDGRAFMDALHVAISGSRCRATQPYTAE